LQLEISIKKSEFTIQRFYLFILPLFGLLHGMDSKRAEVQLKAFLEILTKSPAFAHSVKFSA
jgi:hypothetical protein